jgi:hypothetical protein
MGAGLGNRRDERPLPVECELLVRAVFPSIGLRRTGRPPRGGV